MRNRAGQALNAAMNLGHEDVTDKDLTKSDELAVLTISQPDATTYPIGCTFLMHSPFYDVQQKPHR